jgi:hypothetical protein
VRRPWSPWGKEGLRTAVVALVVATGSVLALPGATGAHVGAQAAALDSAKKLCDAAVARRLTSLGSVKADLDATPPVASADRATLDAQIDATRTGLTALKATFDADATLAKVRTDCRRVVSDYRVYELSIPKVELVRAAGHVQAAAGTLKHLAGLLQAEVNAARGRNKDITSAQGYVTDLGLKADEATKAVAGIPTAALPLDAAGYPANRPVLVAARASVDSAHGALTGAIAAAGSAIAALKALG